MPARKVAPSLKADLRAVKEALDGAPLTVGLDPDQPAPRWLSPVAREEWARVMTISRMRPRWLQEADVQTVAGWCASVALFRSATEDVAERGHLIRGRGKADKARGADGTVKNPSGFALQAASAMRAFAQQLGFSRASRTSIPVGPLEDPESDDDSLWTLG